MNRKTQRIIFSVAIMSSVLIVTVVILSQIGTNNEPNPPFFDEDYQFTHLPTAGENISYISPLGWLAARDRTSPDLPHPLGDERHHIFFNDNFQSGLEIYAPGSGEIEYFSISPSNEFGFTFYIDDFRSYYMDHIGSLSQAIQSKLEERITFAPDGTQQIFYISPRIPVEAGDIIGYTKINRYFDWGAIDTTVFNGIANRSHYTWDKHVYGVSPYDLASEELKPLLQNHFGLYTEIDETFHPQVDSPIGGTVRNDINNTLQGIWFYDHVYSSEWGQKIALFSPYCVNHSRYQIRLSIPEQSIYGNWDNLTFSETGTVNLKPNLVTTSTGIVGYILNPGVGVGETGLVLVQMISDTQVKYETFEGVYSMPETPAFTENALLLYR